MKVKGADLIDFWMNWSGWRNDVYVEEAPVSERQDATVTWTDGLSSIEEDDAPAVDPAATYDVTWGLLGWQGKGEKPKDFDDDLCRVLKKYLKEKKSKTFAVEVPLADVDAFKAYCKEHKWKVS